MINYKNAEWNELFDDKCDRINSQRLGAMTNRNLTSKSAPQNITLQVNGEEEEKYFISTNNLSVNHPMTNVSNDNSLQINHDNGLSQSCLSLNQFDSPVSTQLSLDSLSSDNCIHAEAGKLFHQQLDKELNKVIPSAQRRKTSVETVQNRYKFNKKRKKNSSKFIHHAHRFRQLIFVSSLSLLFKYPAFRIRSNNLMNST